MQQQKSGFMMWIMWFLASFFYAYQYVLRVLPNIMMFDIIERFHIDAAAFGQYSGFYYIGYAGMHIPVGLLLDKYGPKRILPLCMFLTVAGLLPLLYAKNWIYPSLGRILIGMGSSAAILGVFKIIRLSFAENKFTLMLGFSVTIGLLGAIYGGQPINHLIYHFGTKKVLEIMIGIGIFLAFTTWWIVPWQAIDTSSKGWWGKIKEVLTQSRILLICLFAGCMVGPLEGFADVWGKEYLKTAYHLNENRAASLPSLIFLGMCFGSPLLSWLVNKTQAYYETIAFSAFIMAMAFILLLSGQLSPSMLNLLFLLIGIFSAYQILAIYLASSYVSQDSVGLTTACANMVIMIFGYFFHAIIGQIMSTQWDGKLEQGIPIYSSQAYTNALVIIPVGLIIAGCGFLMIILQEHRKSPLTPQR